MNDKERRELNEIAARLWAKAGLAAPMTIGAVLEDKKERTCAANKTKGKKKKNHPSR